MLKPLLPRFVSAFPGATPQAKVSVSPASFSTDQLQLRFAGQLKTGSAPSLQTPADWVSHYLPALEDLQKAPTAYAIRIAPDPDDSRSERYTSVYTLPGTKPGVCIELGDGWTANRAKWKTYTLTVCRDDAAGTPLFQAIYKPDRNKVQVRYSDPQRNGDWTRHNLRDSEAQSRIQELLTQTIASEPYRLQQHQRITADWLASLKMHDTDERTAHCGNTLHRLRQNPYTEKQPFLNTMRVVYDELVRQRLLSEPEQSALALLAMPLCWEGRSPGEVRLPADKRD